VDILGVVCAYGAAHGACLCIWVHVCVGGGVGDALALGCMCGSVFVSAYLHAHKCLHLHLYGGVRMSMDLSVRMCTRVSVDVRAHVHARGDVCVHVYVYDAFLLTELVKRIFDFLPQENPDAEVSGQLLAEDRHPKDAARMRTQNVEAGSFSANREERAAEACL